MQLRRDCDDPYTSNFFKHFALRFNFYGLKRLIAASYDPSPIAGTQLPFAEIAGMAGSDRKAYVFDTTRMPDLNRDGAVDLEDARLLMKTVKNVVRPLQGNGDFRGRECVELLEQADIVVTNPPFSLFREFVAQLEERGKRYLIIGNQNAITYKEIFRMIKENRLWLGHDNGGTKWFRVPDDYDIQTESRKKIENGVKYFSMGSIMWFTNLDHKKRHEFLRLGCRYKPQNYPRYDHFDAIEVSQVAAIPGDWPGAMGVPVTFLDKYNPDQFEILGITNHGDMLGVPYRDGNCFAEVNGTRKYVRIIIKHKAGGEIK